MDAVILYSSGAVLFIASAVTDWNKTKRALRKGVKALERIFPQLLVVLVIVSITLALFDADFISKYIGDESGIFGMIGSAVVGSVTLIPGFVAFPAAGELLKNGAGVLQIAVFVSALMMVGVVTLPMEISYFGKRTAITRNVFAFIFTFIAGGFVAWMVGL
ncbi:MAG: permease [Spirochaetota bacterium]